MISNLRSHFSHLLVRHVSQVQGTLQLPIPFRDGPRISKIPAEIDANEKAEENDNEVFHAGLTRHKISDREPSVASNAGKKWMANTQEVDRRLARGSLHRLVRPLSDQGLTCGILNCFHRRSCSSGGTSSTCVATHQILPQ